MVDGNNHGSDERNQEKRQYHEKCLIYLGGDRVEYRHQEQTRPKDADDRDGEAEPVGRNHDV